MFPAERRRLILELVVRDGAASLRDLAAAVDTSEVTVRRDLRRLESEGLLERRHGGALAPSNGPQEPTYSEKSQVAGKEKAAIAAAAARLVSPGDAVLIGAGTTTQAFARRLLRIPDLTVMTNSILVAQVLAGANGIEVMMTGGTLRGSTFALIGASAEQSLTNLHAAKVFLSGNGLSAERGLSTPNSTVASMDHAMAAAGKQVIVLADHTKVGVDAMVQTVPPEKIDTVVTDSGTGEDQLRAFRAAGIAMTVADDQPARGPVH